MCRPPNQKGCSDIRETLGRSSGLCGPLHSDYQREHLRTRIQMCSAQTCTQIFTHTPSWLAWVIHPHLDSLPYPDFSSHLPRTAPLAPRTSEKCSALNLTVFPSVGSSTRGRRIAEVSELLRGPGTPEDGSGWLIGSQRLIFCPRKE